MVTLALDTSTVIELVRGRDRGMRHRYRHARETDVTIMTPVLIMYELVNGARLSRVFKEEIERLEEVLVDVPVVDFAPSDVTAASMVNVDLHRRGEPIGDIDILIAGQALARNWTVVTRNIRHFDWSKVCR